MLRIGQFARLSGLSIDTLRHYDAAGVLAPVRVDGESGYRLYDASQLVTVGRIRALKDAGFSLPEIARIVHSVDAPELIELLRQRALDMQSALHREQERLDRLLSSIFLIQNGGIPPMNEITLKAVEPILVCAQRRQVAKRDFDAALEEMWPAVNAHIRDKGGKTVIPCMMRYHGGVWNQAGDMLDIEVIEPLAGEIPGGGEIVVYTLPAVPRMASLVYKGPFGGVGGAFDGLYEWIAQNGMTPDGPAREIYHKGDWLTDDPREYITELQVPLTEAIKSPHGF